VDGFLNLLWTNDAEKRKAVENSLNKRDVGAEST
jgi:hypothetical protein